MQSRIHVLRSVAIDISSTLIRYVAHWSLPPFAVGAHHSSATIQQRSGYLRSGASIRYLTPDSVIEYIKAHDLFA